jgi:hypothetical protein
MLRRSKSSRRQLTMMRAYLVKKDHLRENREVNYPQTNDSCLESLT